MIFSCWSVFNQARKASLRAFVHFSLIARKIRAALPYILVPKFLNSFYIQISFFIATFIFRKSFYLYLVERKLKNSCSLKLIFSCASSHNRLLNFSVRKSFITFLKKNLTDKLIFWFIFAIVQTSFNFTVLYIL